MIVVDTNVVAYCWIRSQRTALAHRVRAIDSTWHVPALWRSELRNTLVGYMRKGEVQPGQAISVMAAAEEALAGCEHLVPSPKVLEVVAVCELSAYDCEFVALARTLGVPLVTEDREILKRFPEIAISMEAFIEANPSVPPVVHQRRVRYAAPTTRKRRTAAV